MSRAACSFAKRTPRTTIHRPTVVVVGPGAARSKMRRRHSVSSVAFLRTAAASAAAEALLRRKTPQRADMPTASYLYETSYSTTKCLPIRGPPSRL
jgi:hypothetical protein